MKNLFFLLVAVPFGAALCAAERLPRCEPVEVGLAPEMVANIDAAVAGEIEKNVLSGCVVCVGRHGKIVMLKSYGNMKNAAETEPAVPMRTDTVFDLASVTKPVATATAIMILADRDKLNIDDPVADYLDEFDTPEKKAITIRQLLTHTAGFPQGPGAPFDDRDEFRNRVLAMNPKHKPGERYLYSCASYIMLGEIVERVSGKDLREFTNENIFKPLGMTDTGFLPGEVLIRRTAPTERQREPGQVHDFQAFALGGISGNAGLFSTADDLAVFMQTMLEKGKRKDKPRLLGEKTVLAMTSPNPTPQKGVRGLGWTMQAGEVHRPKNMSSKAFGHGGYTGNAVWIDPEFDVFVIFLSNRPHRVVYPLASRIGDVVVEAVTSP